MARDREIRVDVLLPVPPLGFLLSGLAVAVLLAVVVAFLVTAGDFSDGTSTVPSTPGPCEPFCSLRSASVLPHGGEPR